MKILFCGDVVGRSGRQAILDYIPRLREAGALDWVVVNGENAAHGFGITPKICQDFYEAGVDIITTGNHVWAQRPIRDYIKTDPHLLRPFNYPEEAPGTGICVAQKPGAQKKFVVIQIMARLFMEPVENPFRYLEKALESYSLKDPKIGGILVDIHGEASAEKMALAHMVDGRVSVVVGTHTHIPTADAQILPGGTGFQSDAGMCGDYDSVIGMEKRNAILRFKMAALAERLSPADKEATLCGIYAEIDDDTGLTTTLQPVRLGGRLTPAFPEAWAENLKG